MKETVCVKFLVKNDGDQLHTQRHILSYKMNQVNLRLLQDEENTDAVLRYLATQPDSIVNPETTSTANMVLDGDGKLQIDYGTYTVNYQGEPILVNYRRTSGPIGLSNSIDHHEALYLSGDLDHVQKFITECVVQEVPEKPDQLKCFIAENMRWTFLSHLPKRRPESVFHPACKAVVADLEQFLGAEREYGVHGIPYKRNYLFYGPPGTGKTSMLTAMASQMGANIFLMSFTQNITDAGFMRLVSKIPPGSIMVLEDVDALFTERVVNDAGNKSMVSFSAILNTLDGIARSHKLITVMTSNYRDRLDKALIRPGRMDYVVEFTDTTVGQRADMFRSYFGTGHCDILENMNQACRGKRVSPAMLQAYLFERRGDVSRVIPELDIILNDGETQFNLYS